MAPLASTFRFVARIPRQVTVAPGQVLARDDFYGWSWQALVGFGLEGVHEGTLLTEEAHSQGFETESWAIDSGEAPRERDWVAAQAVVDTEFYFTSLQGAQSAATLLSDLGLAVGAVEEQLPQDWDAEWKASFSGARVKPFWTVIPPWVRPGESPFVMGGVESVIQEVVVRVNPGAGFGTGTHETTQLCLEALGGLALERIADRGKLADAFDGLSVLDFGSGSGILGIACALLGARVEAVEIDPLAIANATENADLNQVRGQVRFSQTLAPSPERFPLVLANILRPVLLEFASELVSRLAPGGALVLSGLMEGDVAEVSARYTALLGGKTPEVFSSGEWRALVFRAPSSLAQ